MAWLRGGVHVEPPVPLEQRARCKHFLMKLGKALRCFLGRGSLRDVLGGLDEIEKPGAEIGAVVEISGHGRSS